jgi:hypothetical protein
VGTATGSEMMNEEASRADLNKTDNVNNQIFKQTNLHENEGEYENDVLRKSRNVTKYNT